MDDDQLHAEISLSFIDEAIKKHLQDKYDVTEMEAIVHGGTLIEVGHIYGRPLLVRIDTRDTERAEREITKIRKTLTAVFQGKEVYEDWKS